jgi:general secretion pathway protein M
MALGNLNAVKSRRLAIGLLAAVVVLVIAAIALPVWLLNRHYDAALADAVDKLERYRRIAATRSEVSRQLEAIRTKETRRFFLRGGAPALSAAEMQEAIRGLVEANGAKLITMQAPVAKDEGRYRQVTVNVQLTANIFALRKLLYAMENHVPYMFADNLMVRTQVPANFRPAPGAEPEMFVQFDVSGYSLTGS